VTITPTDAERLAEAQAEVARLNKWADGFSDAQLKERQLCEELLREKDTTIATLRQERDEARAALVRIADGKNFGSPLQAIAAKALGRSQTDDVGR